MAEARQGTMTPVCPERLARMRVVDKGVRVMAVSIPVTYSTQHDSAYKQANPEAANVQIIQCVHVYKDQRQ